ncbi:MAG: HAD family phosphatase [Selenomonadaceae bacterium]|nr:HAD family phosphatase [Selenomonadaceae bacterium]MBQ6131817.1 HAD family phosphatase [Selenomonadaceae bacterium]
MIRLFVTDIDGTLLPVGSGVVPAKNIEAVQAMVKAGVKVAIATGRMYSAALPIAAQLGVPVPIIAYNGALIKSSAGEILHAQYMDAENVLELINFFEKRGWHLQSYSDDILYVPERNELVKFYEKMIRVEAVEVGWDGLRALTKNIPKLLTVSDTPEEALVKLDEAKKFFSGRVEITRSAARFTEFMALGVSKAGAIKILAEKFGVDNAEILAIGDSDNDLAMITSVGCGVAMGNAVPAVKAAVTRITDTCENDGFAKAVYDYVL